MTEERGAERERLTAELRHEVAILNSMLRTLGHAIDQDRRVVVAATVNGLEEQAGKVYDASERWLNDPAPQPIEGGT